MCGILGFIGKSKNPEISFELVNQLLIKTEVRGDHATGFWACEHGDGKVFFDKEPIKSSLYISRSIWHKQFASADTDLMIGHCRLTSMNVGHEKVNKNNHPHVSADKRLALVHNGRVPEYKDLKGRYELRSECDSEILLSMYESGYAYSDKEEVLKKEFPKYSNDISLRLMGLRELFGRVNYGAMAVAIGEREDNGGRWLCLFRDEDRPLHVVDMREKLGQVFFCSTPEIWKNATDACPAVKNYIISNQRVIDFPAYHVWFIHTAANPNPSASAWESLKDTKNSDGGLLYQSQETVPPDVWNKALEDNEFSWTVRKFRIGKVRFHEYERDEEIGVKLPRIKSEKALKVISRLGTDEEVVTPKTETKPETSVKECRVTAPPQKKMPTIFVNRDADPYGLNEEEDTPSTGLSQEPIKSQQEINMKEFEELVKDLRKELSDLESTVQVLNNENSLTPRDFDDVVSSLRDLKNELQANMIFLKK